MPTIATLEDFFLHELTDVYGAEKQITFALPEMIDAVDSDELRDLLEEHLEVTETQVNRLEEIFSLLGKDIPKHASCKGMAGILEEGRALLEEEIADDVLDAAIICGCQKVEHYEIATYGTLAELAKQLGREDVKDMLGETLDEEKEADAKLTAIAERIVNREAVHA